jgi:hypothetical protein
MATDGSFPGAEGAAVAPSAGHWSPERVFDMVGAYTEHLFDVKRLGSDARTFVPSRAS